GFGIRRALAYLGNEPISDTRHGLDVWISVVLIAQGLPQRGDVPIEVVLLDADVRPDRVHQVALGNQRAMMLHQYEQGLKGLTGHRDKSIVPRQPVLLRLQPEGPKLEDGGLGNHRFSIDWKLPRHASAFSGRLSDFILFTSRSGPAWLDVDRDR